jgi:hypothetical protein
MERPKMNPAHAAERSNAGQTGAPSFCWRKTAVAGIGMSGVTVPTMIMSRSFARTPALSRARSAANRARSLVTIPSGVTRLSLMPVRSVIHASVVSTIFSRSTLVRTMSGR